MYRAEPHYHIHWTWNATLDWESFRTREEAEARAKQLVRPGEKYEIEESGAGCPRCRDTVKQCSGHPNALALPDR
jgi:hypothetical protein